MAAPEYWLAVCQHPICGWEAVMGSAEDAEVAKEGHAVDQPGHSVTVLASDHVQAECMSSLRQVTASTPPEGLPRMNHVPAQAHVPTDCGECHACARGR